MAGAGCRGGADTAGAVFTMSGAGAGSVLIPASCVSPVSCTAACLGPRSRMSRTEKLEVLEAGILMDSSLTTEAPCTTCNI